MMFVKRSRLGRKTQLTAFLGMASIAVLAVWATALAPISAKEGFEEIVPLRSMSSSQFDYAEGATTEDVEDAAN